MSTGMESYIGTYIVRADRAPSGRIRHRADQASDARCTRGCQRLATLRPRMDEIVAGYFEDPKLRVDGKAGDLMTMDFAA